MKKLSYVITTRNKLPYLKEVMNELLANIKEDEEIIVVDGVSTDGTVDYLEELYMKNLIDKFISEKDYGEAHGYNKGLLLSEGILIKPLADDDVFSWPVISICKDFMLKHSDVDMMVSNGASTNYDVRSSKLFYPMVYNTEYENWKNNKIPFAFCGLGIMLRRSSLSLLGLFNPSFVRVDAEFSLRSTWSNSNITWYTGMGYVRILNPYSNSNKYLERVQLEGEILENFYRKKKNLDGYVSNIEISYFNRETSNKNLESNNFYSEYIRLFQLSKKWLETKNRNNPGLFMTRNEHIRVSPDFLDLYYSINKNSYQKSNIINKCKCFNYLSLKDLYKEKKSLRLHLGCGERYMEGYINIDYPPSEHSVQGQTVADMYADITELYFPDNSIDEIRLHHVFEHFDRVTALLLLCRWHRWLKTGGDILIETPDLQASLELTASPHLTYKDEQAVLRHIFGSHEAEWAIHKDGWYKEKFKHILDRLGFEFITFEFTQWKMTRNVIVRAKKKDIIPILTLKQIAKEILRDSLIDNSSSEEKLWNVLCQKFDRQFGINIFGESPLVSIFMPVYNGEKYLAETLDSILSQTFHNYELIIADDGSTDKTVDIARTYEEKDKRIKLLTLLHGGEVKTRNEAIKHTYPGSKYLLNHDCDDISLPDKLTRQVSYLEEHPEISIVGTFATYFDDYGNDRGSPQIEWEPARIRETFGDVNSMINSAALIRRKVFDKIGGYREEFRSVDDYDFFARALLAGFELANIPEVLHKIRLHKSSIGSTKSELQEKLAKQIKSDYKSQVYSKTVPGPLCDSKIEGKSLKLHLGCGDIKIPGFINIDIDKSLPAVDVVDNIMELNRFNENSASIIYACHVLEHFSSDEILAILRRWYDVLEPGGELRISVPDIDRIVDIYKKNLKHFMTPPNTPWIGLIYGGQSDEYDFHKTGFNFTYLRYLLEEAGFIEIGEYSHYPHWLGIHDASLAKEPFNEYISLNIKGKKPEIGQINKSNKSLSILHTAEFYYPHIGGAETVVQQVSERLVKRGHKVTVATTRLRDRNFTELNGVRIKEFSVEGSMGTGFKGEDIDNYQNFLLDYPCDVMMNYAAQQWATDLAFNVIEKIKGVKIIAPCGYSALLDSHTIRWPQFTDYFTNVIPKILPLYDGAIYHSAVYKDYEYAKNYGFKNGVIIPNGIDEDEFTVKPSVDFREKYNIKTKYLGLCVANFYEGKGQDRVIECVKKMKRKDFTMVFIGKEGDLLVKLKALTSGLKVLFLVNIPREDTVAAYHSADIFIFGSHIEASPLVIIEAKASKTPFVSTDCGNVREWKGGIVCNADDMAANVNKILNDKSLRKGLAEEGYKEWKEYLTWDIVVDKYEELYLRLYHEKVKGVKTSLTVWTDELKFIQKKIEEDYSDLSLYIKAASILLKNNCINDAMKYIEDGMELDSDNKELVEIYEKMVKGL